MFDCFSRLLAFPALIVEHANDEVHDDGDIQSEEVDIDKFEKMADFDVVGQRIRVPVDSCDKDRSS